MKKNLKHLNENRSTWLHSTWVVKNRTKLPKHLIIGKRIINWKVFSLHGICHLLNVASVAMMYPTCRSIFRASNIFDYTSHHIRIIEWFLVKKGFFVNIASNVDIICAFYHVYANIYFPHTFNGPNFELEQSSKKQMRQTKVLPDAVCRLEDYLSLDAVLSIGKMIWAKTIGTFTRKWLVCAEAIEIPCPSGKYDCMREVATI